MTPCPESVAATPLNHRVIAIRQGGQALVEGIAVLGVVLLLGLAIAWLGRFQDMALSAQNASRHAAFQQARAGTAMMSGSLSRHYFSGPAHQWADHRGRSVLGDGGEGVGVSLRRQVLESDAQPGGRGAYASALRSDWGIQDPGLLRVDVALSAALPPLNGDAPNRGWLRFDARYPALRRHTAILTGAGHAPGDTQVQQMLAQSELAWHSSARLSILAGEKVTTVMSRVDSAWNRTAPDFDWLGPWAGRIPEHHLAVAGRRHHD
jgi:hypothetical protein